VLDSAVFPYLLGLSAFLFTVGATGVLIRRNPLVVFMCIELMLNAANVALVAYGRFLNSEEGQIFAFMVIIVAAAEVVVGLALITQVFRLGRELDIDELNELSEAEGPEQAFNGGPPAERELQEVRR
jgi:NADH-quinone oxidoreductase subunit K